MKTKANLALDFPVLKESNFLGFMDQCRKTIMAEQHSNHSRLLEMELKKKKKKSVSDDKEWLSELSELSLATRRCQLSCLPFSVFPSPLSFQFRA